MNVKCTVVHSMCGRGKVNLQCCRSRFLHVMAVKEASDISDISQTWECSNVTWDSHVLFFLVAVCDFALSYHVPLPEIAFRGIKERT